jgi:hypothetical protein
MKKMAWFTFASMSLLMLMVSDVNARLSNGNGGNGAKAGRVATGTQGVNVAHAANVASVANRVPVANRTLGVSRATVANLSHVTNGRHGIRGSVYISAPFFGVSPWNYYPSAYDSPYYSAPIGVQQSIGYVEQIALSYNDPPMPNESFPVAPSTISMSPPIASEPSWFYCMDTKTYYPYVQTCQSPWQRVTTQILQPSH